MLPAIGTESGARDHNSEQKLILQILDGQAAPYSQAGGWRTSVSVSFTGTPPDPDLEGPLTPIVTGSADYMDVNGSESYGGIAIGAVRISGSAPVYKLWPFPLPHSGTLPQRGTAYQPRAEALGNGLLCEALAL